jgi:predicted nucleotidyltransferase
MDNNLSIIKQYLLGRFPEAKVYLYGSRAKGTNRPDSDYDISCLVTTDTKVNRIDPIINQELSKLCQYEVHVVFCSIDNEFNLQLL